MCGQSFDTKIIPIFFGTPHQQLYGCQHVPLQADGDAQVVVICSPIGQEYIRSHRAIFQLATRLAQKGCYVLRFDYFGCGDSFGDFEDGSLKIWGDNINSAIELALAKSGAGSLSLIGLRLGATLALRAMLPELTIDRLVIWEPIINGIEYLKEMTNSHREYTKNLSRMNKRHLSKPSSEEEILGFRHNHRLLKDLEEIRYDQINMNAKSPALMICNGEERVTKSHYGRFCKEHPQITFKVIEDHQAWEERIYKRLIPFNTIKYIVQWIRT